jgi:HPr kinase/phosphorylase
MVQALKRMGHDPAKDFNDRLIAEMTRPQATNRRKSIKLSTPPFPREEPVRPVHP